MSCRFRRLLQGLVVVAWASTALADDASPTRGCIEQLSAAIVAIGDPKADEVRSQRSELVAYVADLDLERRGRDLDRELSSLKSKEWQVDFDARKLGDKSRQIDGEQHALNDDWKSVRRRVKEHNDDAKLQHAAAAAVDRHSEDSVDAVNAWGERGDARRVQLHAEISGLSRRQKALDERRQALFKEVSDIAERQRLLVLRHAQVDEDVGVAVADCSSALTRATALLQIRDTQRHEGGDGYRPPRQLAEEALAELSKNLAKAGALKGLETRAGKEAFKRVARNFTTKQTAKAAAARVALAFTVADIGMDVEGAGLDQSTKEFERSLLLLGDYGRAMKALVDDRGTEARADPAYDAMRSELRRLAAGMPSSGADMAVHGLGTASAVTEAFIALGKEYTTHKVAKYLGGVAKYMNNEERKALGAAGTVACKWMGETAGDAYIDTALDQGRKVLSGESGRAPVTLTEPVQRITPEDLGQ